MPSDSVLKRLFGRSGNRCAFPDCRQPLIDDGGRILGEVAHIAARRPGGPRFDPRMSEADREAFGNLLLLCPTHHALVDLDPQEFDAAWLTQAKLSADTEGIQLSDEQLLMLGDVDIEIEVAEVLPARNFDNDWFIIRLDGFYLLNNMERNAIVQFELSGSLDGESLCCTRRPYDDLRKEGHPALTPYLPNPKDAGAGTSYADPLGFLVERRRRQSDIPIIDPVLHVAERRSRRRFRLALPGHFYLAAEQSDSESTPPRP